MIGSGPEYTWHSASMLPSHAVLLPTVLARLRRFASGKRLRILDLGCGNGFVARTVADEGHEVVGVDVSEQGLKLARAAYPEIPFLNCSIYDQNMSLVLRDQFDVVISLEVIEHLHHPRALFAQAARLLASRGAVLISTPYHGYLKNFALSALGRWDRHLGPGWDGGHVKFFSRSTLTAMAAEEGFECRSFAGVGRVPFLWRSMVTEFTLR